MNRLKTKIRSAITRLISVAVVGVALLLAVGAHAAAPGITGPSFSLTASADFITQPDGQMIYSWGYGCTAAPAGFLPAAVVGSFCNVMQIPGPTMIVTEGQLVTVTLTNNLPGAAGNASIVFPGFQVATTGGARGLLTQEAVHGGTVTYTFTPQKPGTYSYHSGTRPDLQVEMGLYGAVIVLPRTPASNCKLGPYSLAASAYGHPQTCYDREYLFQFSEMSLKIHQQVEAQVTAGALAINVTMEPYKANYFLINGRSAPDDMDTNYAPTYPHQPYNGNPHMHPGELVLMRVIGQGRLQHPFHYHGNHARVLARDGNLILAQNDPLNRLAGPLLFTTPTVSGQTVDQIFQWTGKGLNWDVYGHTNPNDGACVPDANGYNTRNAPPASMPYEWCADHGKPFPVTPPDPTIVANGLWYGGTQYLGLNKNNNLGALPPGFASENPNAGYAFMWHSHNEREITTNDIFPGGMMMMMIVDSPDTPIDETL